jgi:hypothetical protein
MSFAVDLSVAGLTERQGRAVEAACRARGAWPVFIARRRRLLGRPRPDEPAWLLWMPSKRDGRNLLTDEATWDAPAWDMEPELLPSLAETIRVLVDELPQGFTLHATWAGAEVVTEERVVSADDLVALVLASRLNELTRYRVPGRPAEG